MRGRSLKPQSCRPGVSDRWTTSVTRSVMVWSLVITTTTACSFVPTLPSVESGGNPPAGMDAGADDNACGAEFVSFVFDHPGSTRAVCIPLRNGVESDGDGATCAFERVNLQVRGDDLNVSIGGLRGLDSPAGTTPFGIGMWSRSLPCPETGFICRYRTIGESCSAMVVQSGEFGAVVEAVQVGACVLQGEDSSGGIFARLAVRSMRLRGRLRLANHSGTTLDGSTLTADCGR